MKPSSPCVSMKILKPSAPGVSTIVFSTYVEEFERAAVGEQNHVKQSSNICNRTNKITKQFSVNHGTFTSTHTTSLERGVASAHPHPQTQLNTHRIMIHVSASRVSRLAYIERTHRTRLAAHHTSRYSHSLGSPCAQTHLRSLRWWNPCIGALEKIENSKIEKQNREIVQRG